MPYTRGVMSQESKPSRRRMLTIWLIPVFLAGLGIAVFAPLTTCRWCDGKGRYVYVNRRAGECPGCHGEGKIGYLRMVYNLVQTPRF